jgi:hypothetical protein
MPKKMPAPSEALAGHFDAHHRRADLLLAHARELFDLLMQEIDVAQDRPDLK